MCAIGRGSASLSPVVGRDCAEGVKGDGTPTPGTPRRWHTRDPATLAASRAARAARGGGSGAAAPAGAPCSSPHVSRDVASEFPAPRVPAVLPTRAPSPSSPCSRHSPHPPHGSIDRRAQLYCGTRSGAHPAPGQASPAVLAVPPRRIRAGRALISTLWMRFMSATQTPAQRQLARRPARGRGIDRPADLPRRRPARRLR